MPTSPESLRTMVSAALANPADFPAFDRVAVKDDRLAIAMSAAAAEWTSLLPAILQAIGDLPLAVVDVVLASDTAADDLEALRDAVAAVANDAVAKDAERLPIKLQRHDGTDRSAMAYLAADQTDHPIYVAKSLADADLVLPVVVRRDHEQADGNCGLFPGFVDRDAIERSQDNGDSLPSPSVAWTLGVQMQLVAIVDQAGNLAAVEASAIPADWS